MRVYSPKLIFTVCLFFGFINCQSMLQNKGQVYYVTQEVRTNESTKDFIDMSMLDSVWRKLYNTFTPKGRNTESTSINPNTTRQTNNEEVNMENMLTELTTAITSAIAGIYCLIKVIMNVVNKMKK